MREQANRPREQNRQPTRTPSVLSAGLRGSSGGSPTERRPPFQQTAGTAGSPAQPKALHADLTPFTEIDSAWVTDLDREHKAVQPPLRRQQSR